MKRLILILFFAIGVMFIVNEISIANDQIVANWECWYNPQIGGCDTGGTIGCLMKPPCY